MAKKNSKKNETVISEADKLFEITAATVKDGLCNYSYEIIQGIGAGDSHQVKGKGIVDDDMLDAFSKLNVHLAVIDDVFEHSGVAIAGINKMHGDSLTLLYTVTGFRLKGTKDDKSVILIGTKNVTTAADRISLETPKILLDKFSSYKYHKELRAALDKAIEEVELYKGGKNTPAEVADDPVNENQAKLDLKESSNSDFEKAKVK